MDERKIIEPPKSVLTRAAENGAVLNLYISVLVLALGFGVVYPVASLALWAGSLALPVLVYRMLRRSQMQSDGALSFAEVWAEGIATFLLGSLVPALLAYVMLRFVAPTFLGDVFTQAVDMLRQQGTARAAEMADVMAAAMKKQMPTPLDVASQIISFNIIVGTFLSLVLAVIVKTRPLRRAMPTPDK